MRVYLGSASKATLVPISDTYKLALCPTLSSSHSAASVVVERANLVGRFRNKDETAACRVLCTVRILNCCASCVAHRLGRGRRVERYKVPGVYWVYLPVPDVGASPRRPAWRSVLLPLMLLLLLYVVILRGTIVKRTK